MEYQIGPDESVSAAVVRAVSALRGVDPCSLKPLAEVLDPDAIDSLFAPTYDGNARRGGRISFVYAGCRIAIENGEFLTVALLERPTNDVRERASSDGGVSWGA